MGTVLETLLYQVCCGHPFGLKRCVFLDYCKIKYVVQFLQCTFSYIEITLVHRYVHAAIKVNISKNRSYKLCMSCKC